jgi:FAD binding domain
MHHRKDIEILDYQGKHYSGRAIKLGAGVQGFDAYEAANNNELQVVGGECPTVGIAGGYTQGGGHSALASKYGLAADQTLEWEVIDGTGTFRTASRDSNLDLYWALSGGGGGTYGVVWSLTAKAHKDIPVSGANLTFTNEGISQDTYYEAVKAYHASLPSIVDAGAMSVWYFSNASFSISPLTGPGISEEDLVGLLKPFTDTLDRLGIPFDMVSKQFPGYLEEFNEMQGPIQVGIAQYGGRLIPRSVVENNNDDLTNAYRHITEDGALFIGLGVNVSKAVAGDVYNAVLPAWRETLIDTVISTPWNFTTPISDMIALQDKMTNDYMPALEALTPQSGAYLNEVCFPPIQIPCLDMTADSCDHW